jgi:hypothetical protein
MNTVFMLLAIYNKPRLSMKETCEAIGISIKTAYNKRSSGTFPVPMAGDPLTADIRDVAIALDKLMEQGKIDAEKCASRPDRAPSKKARRLGRAALRHGVNRASAFYSPDRSSIRYGARHLQQAFALKSLLDEAIDRSDYRLVLAPPPRRDPHLDLNNGRARLHRQAQGKHRYLGKCPLSAPRIARDRRVPMSQAAKKTAHVRLVR